MGIQQGSYIDNYITSGEQLKNLSRFNGRILTIDENITIFEPLDLTGYRGTIIGVGTITYAGASSTSMIIGTPLASKAINISSLRFEYNDDTVSVCNINGNLTQILSMEFCEFINNTGNGVKFGTVQNMAALRFTTILCNSLASGITLGNMGILAIINSSFASTPSDLNEKNLLTTNGIVKKIFLSNIVFEKQETSPGVKSNNEFFWKRNIGSYIYSGNVIDCSTSGTELPMINPSGEPKEELENTYFSGNTNCRNTGNIIDSSGASGVITVNTTTAKYSINISTFSVNVDNTIAEGVHLIKSVSEIFFKKNFTLETEIRVVLAASGANFDASLYVGVIDSEKAYTPTFNGTTNEITVENTNYEVNDKIYFIEGQNSSDQLPTGITTFELKYIKTITPVGTRRMVITISNTLGGAELDFGSDGIGYASMLKIKNEMTFNSTTDRIILNNHGFLEGDTVLLCKLTNAVDPLNLDTDAFRAVMYVRNPTTNDFQIGDTPSTLFTFDDNGSGTFFVRKVSLSKREDYLTPSRKTISISKSYDMINGKSFKFFISNDTGTSNITIQNPNIQIK